MSNKIEIKTFPVDANFSSNMKNRLSDQAAELNSANIYLLSFHDDGVVWGKIKSENGSQILLTSGDKNTTGDFKLSNTPSPEFRSETLQELRLFGETGQLHIWQIGENQFDGRLALESYLEQFESIEESQVLYGTKTENNADEMQEFTIVADGSEGLRHAFPQPIQTNKFDDKKRPLRLHVKHYVEYDGDGCARIAFSRLVNVSVE